MRVRLHFVLAAGLISGATRLAHAQQPQEVTAPVSPFKDDPAFHHTKEILAHGKMPRLVHSVTPTFSLQALQQKISGYVFISLVVDELGLPTRLTVLRGLGHGLDEQALEAVSKYRFKPGVYDGQPISVPLTVAVNFQRN
jgi:vitamin B12 transporter